MSTPTRALFLLFAAFALAAVAVEPGWAHGAGPPAAGSLWLQWSWSSLPGLAVLGAVYWLGLRALWRRAGAGRGISRDQAAAFAAGLVVLFLALVSPLDHVSEELFSAHMLQHLLLVLIAAPLFIIGRFSLALAWLLPPRLVTHAWKSLGGRVVWNFLSRPAVAWLLHAGTIWFWHMPGPYEAALRNVWLHLLEHAAFFITAALFWQVFFTLAAAGSGASARFGLGVLLVFAMGLANGLLGVLIAFSPYVWYPAYVHDTTLLGLTGLQDQHLAGVIMWVPAGMIYLGSALTVMARWIFAREALENPNA